MNHPVPFALGVILVAVCASPMAQAPVPAVAKPTFEVASVRPNTSGVGGAGINIQPGGRVTALNASVDTQNRQLIDTAKPAIN